MPHALSWKWIRFPSGASKWCRLCPSCHVPVQMVKIFFLSQQMPHGSLSWVWALGSLLSSFSFILFSTSRHSLKHVYKMRLYSIPYSLVPWRFQFIESNKARSSKRILLNRLWALLCYLVTDIHLPGNCAVWYSTSRKASAASPVH